MGIARKAALLRSTSIYSTRQSLSYQPAQPKKARVLLQKWYNKTATMPTMVSIFVVVVVDDDDVV